jgi:glucan phosphoethanolaminetransferase (alkaline phosphatase superfamily)
MALRLLLLTLFYVSFVQLPLLTSQLKWVGDDYGLAALILVLATLSSALWVYATSHRRWAFLLMQLPVIVVATIAGYMWLVQDFILSSDIIATFLETTPAEAGEFMSPSLMIAGAIGLFLALCIGIWVVPKNNTQCHRWPILALFLVLIISAIPVLRVNALFLPYTLIHQVLLQSRDHLLPSHQADNYASVHRRTTEPVTLVVVIGESLRADHLGINGYGRETTPLLAKREGLVSFRQVRSCAAITRYALPCILNAGNNPSFVSVLRQVGFHTTWLGTQGDPSFTHNYLRAGRDAEQSKFTNTPFASSHAYDRELLPWFQATLARGHDSKLIVLHTLGSHWKYHQRYPREDVKFAPNCNESLPYLCERQHVINSYDNSVRYTDGFLDALITELENVPALLIYISDHGESLGENGAWLHGDPNNEDQRQAAMMVWASKNWQKRYPARFQQLVNKRDQSLAQEVVFHTVLDCADVAADFVDPASSLCYKPGQQSF